MCNLYKSDPCKEMLQVLLAPTVLSFTSFCLVFPGSKYDVRNSFSRPRTETFVFENPQFVPLIVDVVPPPSSFLQTPKLSFHQTLRVTIMKFKYIFKKLNFSGKLKWCYVFAVLTFDISCFPE